MTSEEAAKRATDEFTAWMLHRGSTPGDEMADTLKGTIMAAIDAERASAQERPIPVERTIKSRGTPHTPKNNMAGPRLKRGNDKAGTGTPQKIQGSLFQNRGSSPLVQGPLFA